MSLASDTSYIATAWCGPLLAGHAPSRTAVTGFFAQGSPGADQAAHQPKLEQPPSGSPGAALPVLAFVPLPGKVTAPVCTWVGSFPRIATTGSDMTPELAMQKLPANHLVHPALYGTVTQVGMPITIEASFGSSRGPAHMYLTGMLDLTPHGSRLIPTHWAITSYWFQNQHVHSPSFILTGKYHWNYAGANIGRGIRPPSISSPATSPVSNTASNTRGAS